LTEAGGSEHGGKDDVVLPPLRDPPVLLGEVKLCWTPTERLSSSSVRAASAKEKSQASHRANPSPAGLEAFLGSRE